MAREPHPKQMAFIQKMEAWCAETGTRYPVLCRTAGVNDMVKYNVRNGTRVNDGVLQKLADVIDANPGGIETPHRKAVTTARLSEAEIEARARAVQREREQRAMAHLRAERPGFNGRRAGSMRPIWEQVA